MTRSDGICQIDGVDIGEVAIAKMNPSTFADTTFVSASAKYALVTKTGERVGAGAITSWSEATKGKIRELINSMEADICIAVFGRAPQPVEGTPRDTPNSDGVPEL